MERIKNQSHSKSAYLLAFSKLFERASYYGFRTIFLLYLMDEAISMPREESLQIYAWFTTGVIIMGVIGGFVGDLVIGNRKAIFIGGVIQILGIFMVCYPSLISFYIGLVLVLIGGGLYNSNLFSSFGKSYSINSNLLDAGFSMYYLGINLGAFLGIMAAGLIGEFYGWTFGFATVGVFMIISILFVLFSKDMEAEEDNIHDAQMGQNIFNIVLGFLIMGIFWGIVEFGSFRMQTIDMAFLDDSSSFSNAISTRVNMYLMVLVGIIFTFIWTFYYSKSLRKLSLGFLFGAVGFGILMFIPEVPLDEHVSIFIASLICLGIAEGFVGPVVLSFITKNTNPKYLAIVISLAFIPTRAFSSLFIYIEQSMILDGSSTVQFCMIGMAMVSIGILVCLFTGKSKKAFKLLDS